MTVTALGDTGHPVDWWFAYKLPENVAPTHDDAAGFETTSGHEYLYLDADSAGPLALSPHRLDRPGNALDATLAQLHVADGAGAASLGWICYNDEIPGATRNDGAKGHSKGVLAFNLDSDTAFWLLHSWPKFADLETRRPGARIYAQTYLCITLAGVDEARAIAEQMYRRQEPQTYDVRLPPTLGSTDIFRRLATAVDVNETDPPCDVTFLSKANESFRLLAKNRHWEKDFWIDLVGPHLRTDIDVESWRRGALPPRKDSDGKHHVRDVLYINTEHLGVPYEWHYTKDHAKWGVSEADGWVCVADINRQRSQERRGGGCVCFRNERLWRSLSGLERMKRRGA